MPVEYFIRYKGLCYDVGTKLKFKARFRAGSYSFYQGVKEGVIEQFINSTVFIRAEDGELYNFSTIRNLVDFDKEIVEIIEPVYYIPKPQTSDRNYNRPDPWDVEVGWIWYIIIMVVGTIFNSRLLIWVAATTIFFSWKSGRFGGNK